MAEHGKYCPIMVAGANTHVSECIGKDCAWWLPYANDCALPVIAGGLADSTIDVAPVVHEKWLPDRWPSWPHRECSRCKIMIPRTKEVPDQYWQYCPNCGAKMDGGNEGE